MFYLNYIPWYSTHQQYRRGKGVAVALHKRLSSHYHSHTIHDDHQLIHLQLKQLLPSDALLHVFCWYLPHSQSTQLRSLDLMSRFTFLTAIVDSITATQPGSLVVIAGDLNAKVGTAMPLSAKAAGAILQHNAACGTRKRQHIQFERKQRHPDSNFSGKLLHDMCQATHLINMTGITSTDSPAAASFTSTNSGKAQKPSRIDHMLLSPSALQHLVQHRVLGTHPAWLRPPAAADRSEPKPQTSTQQQC